MFGIKSTNGYMEVLPGVSIKTLAYGNTMLTTEFILKKGSELPIHNPDTFYTPANDLPIGIHYWRVGKSDDTSTWSKIHTLWENEPSVILYLPFDGDSGKVLADASGKSNTGYIDEYNSSPRRVPGICGEALNFNGSTDKALVYNTDNLNCTRKLTNCLLD